MWFDAITLISVSVICLDRLCVLKCVSANSLETEKLMFLTLDPNRVTDCRDNTYLQVADASLITCLR